MLVKDSHPSNNDSTFTTCSTTLEYNEKSQTLNLSKLDDKIKLKFDYEVNNKYTNVGTPAYQPPELLLGLDHYSTSFDIWSVGCIFVAICTGKILFGEKNSLFGDRNSQVKDNNSLGVLKYSEL